MDKIIEITKKTYTYMAKLMMDFEATKKHGIKAFKNMTDKVDKLTKDVETTYDSFCSKVINTLKYFMGKN